MKEKYFSDQITNYNYSWLSSFPLFCCCCRCCFFFFGKKEVSVRWTSVLSIVGLLLEVILSYQSFINLPQTTNEKNSQLKFKTFLVPVECHLYSDLCHFIVVKLAAGEQLLFHFVVEQKRLWWTSQNLPKHSTAAQEAQWTQLISVRSGDEPRVPSHHVCRDANSSLLFLIELCVHNVAWALHFFLLPICSCFVTSCL